MGRLCFTWSSKLSLWSVLKIAVGTELRGRGGGSFGSRVGTPHPLPLPAGPCVRKSHGFRGLRSGRVLEPPSPHTPTSSRRGDPEGKGLEPREKVPEAARWLQAWRGFLSCLWAHRAWEPLGLNVAGLPESRQAGEESLASPP